jgi:hypothetical protein
MGNIILEAADVLAVNTATNSGLNVNVAVFDFDNTAPIKSVHVSNPSTGDNVLYTAPNGGSAMVLSSDWGFPGIGNNNMPSYVVFVADGATTRNVYLNLYANGGSAGSTNKITATGAIGAANRGFLIAAITMASQDVLSFNVDTGATGQLAWVNVVEFTQ